MSQHIWKVKRGDREWEILTGYDNPLRRFFLVIEDLSMPNGFNLEAYMFSNLNLKMPDRFRIQDIIFVLEGMRIWRPDNLAAELADDRRTRSPRTVRYEVPDQIL